ncbi:MAG: hypothetical protein RQ753_08620 [Desulfurivibrionaceae bacterium]|nr:hypothetical protein [Desulfobulbales bacterium]MDT8335749.1 hypothetical protein [Desulfurivibrionaceae bacterium]
MLVAQAECEDLILVTADKDIPKYQVQVLLNSRAGAFIGIINIVAALHPHLSGLLTDPEIREPLVYSGQTFISAALKIDPDSYYMRQGGNIPCNIRERKLNKTVSKMGGA